MYKACLLGAAFDTGNMGVSALAASLVKLFSEARPDSHFYLFNSNRSQDRQSILLNGKEKEIELINFRLSPKAELRSHLFWLLLMAVTYRLSPFQNVRSLILRYNPRLNNLAACDFIGDIRGGDSFSDIYGLSNFLMGSIPISIVILLGKKFVLLPQTYGPYKSKIARLVAQFILSRSSCNLSRDQEGLDVVADLLGEKNRNAWATFCPDVAFALDSVAPKSIEIEPAIDLSRIKPLVGLNINGLMFNGGYTRDNMFNLKLDYKEFAFKVAEAILINTDSHLLLIPHTYAPPGDPESDNHACEMVFRLLEKKYAGRVFKLSGSYNQFEIKSIIKDCCFFIGSRMHACIAGLSQGTPTAGVAYSRKFIGVFETVGAGNCIIDARTAELPNAVDNVIRLYMMRDEISTRIKSKADDLLRDLRCIFDGLVSADGCQG